MQRQSLWDFSNIPRAIQTLLGRREGTQDPPAIARSVSGTHVCCSWGQASKRASSDSSTPLHQVLTRPGEQGSPSNCRQGLVSVMG